MRFGAPANRGPRPGATGVGTNTTRLVCLAITCPLIRTSLHRPRLTRRRAAALRRIAPSNGCCRRPCQSGRRITVQADGVEPWPAFRDRVSDVITGIMLGPSGREVAVFTSGGPIGFAVHLAMKGPSQSFLEVNWRIRNCSVTEFLFDKVRLTLDSFNWHSASRRCCAADVPVTACRRPLHPTPLFKLQLRNRLAMHFVGPIGKAQRPRVRPRGGPFEVL